MSVTAATKPITGISKVFKGLGSIISKSLGPLGVLLQIFEALGIIQPILDVLMSFVQILGTAFMPALMMLLDIIIPLIPPFQELVTAITPLITLIIRLITPLGAIQILASLLAVGMVYLATQIDKITPYITAFSEWIASIDLSKVIGWLQTLGNWLSTLWDGIVTGFTTGWTNFTNFFSNLWDTVTGWLETGIDALKNWFLNIWNRIVEWIEQAFEGAKDKIVEFFT